MPPVPFDRAIKMAESIQGWMSTEELTFLYHRAGQLSPGQRWLELGTWRGRSFAAVALGLPAGCHLTAVDHWNGSDDEITTTHAEARLPGRLIFQNFLAILGALSQHRPDLILEVFCGSNHLCDTPADVVFVDGSHHALAVQADLAHWTPLLRPGGSLLGHDYNHASVQLALAAAGIEVQVKAGSIWERRA